MQFKKIKNKLHGAAADSLVLTFVKVVTAALGLLTTKLLSTQFSLHEYGTYSQAMLLVSTVTSISILGLSDATNYFYNAADDEERKQQSIATVFGIQYIIGLGFGLIICLAHIPIINYFKNEDLKTIIFFAAWMPVFNNLIPMLQVLFISIGKAKTIAVRNFVVSLSRLFIVGIASFITQNIRTVFILILFLDIAQVAFFYCSFSKNRFRIRLSNFRVELVKPILSFSIPMTVFVFTNALSRDIDKYVISYFTDTQTLAVYTNAAKILPFDMLTASFLTVLIPIITRQVRSENYTEAQNTLKAYLRVGYLATWIMVSGSIVNAKETMLFFYDTKYLSGLSVFIIYLFVDMIKFANVSLILSAKGKTKTLMKWSVISLIVNAILNVLAYLAFGIVGPAITTLVITILLMVIYLSISAREIDTSFIKLFDLKEVTIEIVQLIIVGIVSYAIKIMLRSLFNSYVIVLVLTYGIFVGCMLLLNKRRLISCLKTINTMK